MSGPPDEKRIASGDGGYDGGSHNSKSNDGGGNEPTYRWDGVGGATRRSGLGSLAGAMATMGLSGHTMALDTELGTNYSVMIRGVLLLTEDRHHAMGDRHE